MFKVNSQLTKRSLSNSGLSELKLLAVGDFTSTAGLLLSSLELLRATLVGDLTERAGSSVLAGGSGSGERDLSVVLESIFRLVSLRSGDPSSCLSSS